jgi:Bacterial Ig domain
LEKEKMKKALRLHQVIGLIAIAGWCGLYSFPATAAMECGGSPAPWTFCKRCTVVAHRSTKRDTPCGLTYDVGRGAEIALVGSRVAKQAHHGRFEVNGASWTYTPAKGFVGTDIMTVEWDLIHNNELFVVFIEDHITVE